MRLLYTDETNLEPDQGEFFVYGGVSIPCENAFALHKEIEDISKRTGYEKSDVIKFHHDKSHKAVSFEDHKKAKQSIIEAAASAEASLYIIVVLHDIAQSGKLARTWAIDTLLFHFNGHLNFLDRAGVAMIDQFKDRSFGQQVKRLFKIGVLDLPFSSEYRLDKVLGIHSSSVGSSNFGSLIDILVGSFRFAINNKDNEEHAKSVAFIMELLSPMFIRVGENGKVWENSLFFSPKEIKIATYFQKYCDLHSFLAKNGIEGSQAPRLK